MMANCGKACFGLLIVIGLASVSALLYMAIRGEFKSKLETERINRLIVLLGDNKNNNNNNNNDRNDDSWLKISKQYAGFFASAEQLDIELAHSTSINPMDRLERVAAMLNLTRWYDGTEPVLLPLAGYQGLMNTLASWLSAEGLPQPDDDNDDASTPEHAGTTVKQFSLIATKQSYIDRMLTALGVTQPPDVAEKRVDVVAFEVWPGDGVKLRAVDKNAQLLDSFASLGAVQTALCPKTSRDDDECKFAE